MSNEVRDNPARNRFEMNAGNDVAVVNYRLAPGVIVLTHTEVPKEREGQGLGSTIVRGVLQIARARGLKVVAACGFVSAFIRKNPEFQDLLVQTDMETR
jgi:predicted GNAT family acetyltransferase